MTDEQMVWAGALALGVLLVLFNRRIVAWLDRIGPRWIPKHPLVSAFGRLLIAGFGLGLAVISVLVLAGYPRSASVVWPWE